MITGLEFINHTLVREDKHTAFALY